MKSARDEKTSVMEKRGLKSNLRDKSDENNEKVQDDVKEITVEKSNDLKSESYDVNLNSNTTKKSKSTKVNNFRVPNPHSKNKSSRNKKGYKKDEKYDNEDKVTTRSKKTHKQLKITDTMKLTAKNPSNGNKQQVVKQNKKSDLIIPLKLEADSITNSTSLAISENEEKIKKHIIKKIDFFTLEIKDLDYTNNLKVYFNFKDNFDKNKELSKVNIILAIYEIALNQNFYGLQNYSNKTISFWNNVKNQPFFGCFFSYFTAETIRKYWRELSSINNMDTMYTVLTDKRNQIDTNDIKLLPLIILLKEYINNNSTGFEEFLLGIDKKKNKAKREELEKISHYLKKKKNRYIPEDERQIDTNEIYDILEKAEGQTKKIFSFDDKFSAIEEIIESFKTIFNFTYNNEFILDALKMNSMDIQKTYDFLCDPTTTKDFIFNECEDNILLNLKNTKLYDGLIMSKGKQAVREREEFLKNEI